jgi:hypothetical protein
MTGSTEARDINARATAAGLVLPGARCTGATIALRRCNVAVAPGAPAHRGERPSGWNRLCS